MENATGQRYKLLSTLWVGELPLFASISCNTFHILNEMKLKALTLHSILRWDGFKKGGDGSIKTTLDRELNQRQATKRSYRY